MTGVSYPANDVPRETHSSYVFCTPAREIPDLSRSRNVRVNKASKVGLHFLSPCFMQADVENPSLLEITSDPFALNEILNLFDLTGLERRYVFCDN